MRAAFSLTVWRTLFFMGKVFTRAPPYHRAPASVAGKLLLQYVTTSEKSHVNWVYIKVWGPQHRQIGPICFRCITRGSAAHYHNPHVAACRARPPLALTLLRYSNAIAASNRIRDRQGTRDANRKTQGFETYRISIRIAGSRS